MVSETIRAIESARKTKAAKARAAGSEKREVKSQATKAIALMVEYGVKGTRLFHGADGRSFFQSRHEAMPINGEAFAGLIQRVFWASEKTALNAAAVKEVQSHFHAAARFGKGGLREAFVRVGSHVGKVYLDLCNPKLDKAKQGIIEIDANGWRPISQRLCPVAFRRPAGNEPLDLPEVSGRLDELRAFINLGSDEETSRRWAKLAAWMVGCLDPHGPYIILLVQGEQGSAKSSLARAARSVFDPNLAVLRTASEKMSAQDLAIACDANRVLAFDNLSTISADLSDNFCQIATGGGFATRKLCADREESIFSYKRPQLMTGIDLKLRSDMAGRTLTINLPPIDDRQRRDERTLWADFATARPRILGGLLNAVVTALANYETTTLENPPRMADAARWAVAAEPSLIAEDGSPLHAGDIFQALAEDRDEAVAAQLESSPLTVPLRKVLDFAPSFTWRGTAEELLEELNRKASDAVQRSRGWPGGAQPLSGALRRLAPNLRHEGIDCQFGLVADHGRRREILIRRVTKTQGDAAGDARLASPEFPALAGQNANLSQGDAGLREIPGYTTGDAP